MSCLTERWLEKSERWFGRLIMNNSIKISKFDRNGSYNLQHGDYLQSSTTKFKQLSDLSYESGSQYSYSS